MRCEQDKPLGPSTGGFPVFPVCGAEQVFESIKHAHESAHRDGATATGSRPSRQGPPSMTITQMRRAVTYCRLPVRSHR